MRDIVK